VRQVREDELGLNHALGASQCGIDVAMLAGDSALLARQGAILLDQREELRFSAALSSHAILSASRAFRAGHVLSA
jgi:hypothetical protein